MTRENWSSIILAVVLRRPAWTIADSQPANLGSTGTSRVSDPTFVGGLIHGR
jgi:hypothetical protein